MTAMPTSGVRSAVDKVKMLMQSSPDKWGEGGDRLRIPEVQLGPLH